MSGAPGEGPVVEFPRYEYAYQPLDYRNPPDLREIMYGPDYRWWCELFCKIPTQQGIRPMRLWPWEEEVLSAGLGPRHLMLKARENGSSTLWCAVDLRDTIANPGGNMLIAADKLDNAVNLMKYVKTIVRHLPEEIRPRIVKDNECELGFDAPLGNEVVALPGTFKSGRSERAARLLCTEMAFWDNPDQYFVAVRGALVKGGTVKIESTANTASDLFAEMWHDEANGYTKHFYGWWANPTHDLAWYLEARRDIKHRHLFDRDYPTRAEDAFLTSSDTYFDLETIERGLADVRQPRSTSTLGPDLGVVKVWKSPIPGHHYVVGVDAAEGKTNRRRRPDFSAYVVVDWATAEVVATCQCRLPDHEFADLLIQEGKRYNTAHMVVERNATGLGVLRRMQALGYTNFYHQTINAATLTGVAAPQREIGWHTSRVTKPHLLLNLAAAVTSGNYSCPDGALWAEVKSFLRQGLSSSPDAHDDMVMAWALAWEGREAYRPSAPVSATPGDGTLSEAERTLRESRRRRRRRVEGHTWTRMW